MYVNIPIIESEQVGIVVLTGGKQRIEKGVDLLLKDMEKNYSFQDLCPQKLK